jgi:hypothetical protein
MIARIGKPMVVTTFPDIFWYPFGKRSTPIYHRGFRVEVDAVSALNGFDHGLMPP